MDRNVGACTRRQESIHTRSLCTSHGRSHYGGCRNPGCDRTAPSGPALLKPEAFLGVTGLHSITHGTQWSIFFNIGLYVLGSIFFRRGKEERRMADSFVDILVPKRGIASLASLSPRIIDLPDKKQINCQVGVFATLGHDRFSTPIDFRLYLPKEWTEDKRRCQKAKVPSENIQLRGKHELALDMVLDAREKGIRFNWVGCDGFYGDKPGFLRGLADNGEIFMADVHKDQRIYLEDPQR